MFKAITVSKDEAGQHVALAEISHDQLPQGRDEGGIVPGIIGNKDPIFAA